MIALWRASSIQDSSIGVYLMWVRRFRRHWRDRDEDEDARLTLSEVLEWSSAYVGPRRGRRVKESSRLPARNALHAWSCALKLLGVSVPTWRASPRPARLPALLETYSEYRRSHRGVAERTLARDVDVAAECLASLRAPRRAVASMRVRDLDSLIDRWSARLSRRTVAGLCSSLRCFLRFLHATGRIPHDLASTIVAPRYRTDERPPRALPWETIRRILRAIPRNHPVGRRDSAMLLLMASYGLGAGEVVQLQLEDIDWRAGVIRACRPKTHVAVELPLLPAVAQALTAYLRRGRPRHTSVREVFVSRGLPHRAVTTAALRHRLDRYAQTAGVVGARLGTHVFRHSHATRQIDAGAPPKVVSDILGHRRPSSTSVYVRVAFRRLRSVALPVPR